MSADHDQASVEVTPTTQEGNIYTSGGANTVTVYAEDVRCLSCFTASYLRFEMLRIRLKDFENKMVPFLSISWFAQQSN